MSDLGYNLWGAVAGAVGTIAVLPPLIWWFLGRMPTARFHKVETSYRETESLHKSEIENGAFDSDDEATLLRLQTLSGSLSVQMRVMREKVCRLHTWKDELKGWWDGLSGEIQCISDGVRKFRAEIAVGSLASLSSHMRQLPERPTEECQKAFRNGSGRRSLREQDRCKQCGPRSAYQNNASHPSLTRGNVAHNFAPHTLHQQLSVSNADNAETSSVEFRTLPSILASSTTVNKAVVPSPATLPVQQRVRFRPPGLMDHKPKNDPIIVARKSVVDDEVGPVPWQRSRPLMGRSKSEPLHRLARDSMQPSNRSAPRSEQNACGSSDSESEFESESNVLRESDESKGVVKLHEL
ncbi:hypothetical protein GY45DRAFT_1438087 [Cubamyces sp. BRFM 1775]|nr:hypothetical protein GY45DRAFT_1438087 [Cubamyces sp. BRFM 1775]